MTPSPAPDDRAMVDDQPARTYEPPAIEDLELRSGLVTTVAGAPINSNPTLAAPRSV